MQKETEVGLQPAHSMARAISVDFPLLCFAWLVTMTLFATQLRPNMGACGALYVVAILGAAGIVVVSYVVNKIEWRIGCSVASLFWTV